jgi:hypothetical protein
VTEEATIGTSLEKKEKAFNNYIPLGGNVQYQQTTDHAFRKI